MTDNVRDGAAGVPDFERDEAVIAAYESAKLRYIRAITQEAETKLRDAFAKRREAINDEIASLRELVKQRQEVASALSAIYAKKLPHRVRKSGVRPPSLWERLRSFNTVERHYRSAAKAAEELDEVNDLLRKRRDRLDTMERETRRSIYLREEAVRKKLQTPEGLAALHADPMVKAAFVKMQSVLDERAAFEERAKRGAVSPEETRDREMAQRNWRFASVPLRGAIIAGIVRYAPLAYYVLRELDGTESLLACDPGLEPLRDVVFDVARSAAGYEASLRDGPAGAPMTILEHLVATAGEREAPDLYARHRATVRADRATAKSPPRDDEEAAVIAMLVLLANAVAAHGAV